jgi:FkbM family methyltransferase
MKILYGISNNTIDITEICYTKLLYNNIIRIPENDCRRAILFSDPFPGIVKKIFIEINNIINEYNDNLTIQINIIDQTINTIDLDKKLENIQSNLKIKYGYFHEEVPEQKMTVSYLTGNEKVLEIGSNIGRNSLIIGYILGKNNNNNFVTLECDSNIANQLIENRNLNNMNFYVEKSALSKRKLIQHGWDTIVSDELLDGYKSVDIITFDQLYEKYSINFDTLVLDCEGAFYYILMDMPEILNNINLIIMENDYWDINKKIYIDYILIKNNFYVDYSESGGWGPCYNNFFEVWKKNIEPDPVPEVDVNN